MLKRMGKQGPCRHCGVASTPLWRNGPPDKPVLCNACGSRWRTRGTLTNYTPLHARDDCEDHHKVSRMKTISINKNKELKSLKRKQQPHYNFAVAEKPSSSNNHGFLKVTDEDISNRSSSGSAISNAESCAQFSAADASDFTGPAQSVVWETLVPSKKRTGVGRSKSSSVDKLAKDLYTIMQEQQSSYICGSSEEDSLYESETPMFSVGHGGVLIKHPSSITREEESEASSLSFDNKSFIANEAYQRSLKFQGLGTGNNKQPSGVEMTREKSLHENSQILTNNGTPLSDIDLIKNKTGIAAGTIAEGPSVKASSKLVFIKRSRDGTDQNAAEVKNTVKSPRVNMKVNCDEETVYIDSSCFSPRSLFTLPPDNSSLVLDSFNFKDENSDQDLLLDMPSNSSFPQAELLNQTSSYNSSVYPLDRR